jgi:hypothetical protein
MIFDIRLWNWLKGFAMRQLTENDRRMIAALRILPDQPQPTVSVTRAAPGPSAEHRRSRRPTTFHRCLAVHMHFAAQTSALT